MKDPKDCLHENFNANVDVNRMPKTEGGPIENYSADVTISCAECGQKFEFIGAPAGISFHRPMVSADFTELRIPIRPATGMIASSLKVEMPNDTDKSKVN